MLITEDGSLGHGIYVKSFKDPKDDHKLHLCLTSGLNGGMNKTTLVNTTQSVNDAEQSAHSSNWLSNGVDRPDELVEIPPSYVPLYTIVTDGSISKRNITHIGFLNTYKLYRWLQIQAAIHTGNAISAISEVDNLKNQYRMEEKPFAIIHPFKIYFADFDTEVLTKYPKGKFVYCKRWWGLKRYYKVEGKEYRIGDEGFKTIHTRSTDRKALMTATVRTWSKLPKAIMLSPDVVSCRQTSNVNEDQHNAYAGNYLVDGNATQLFDRALVAEIIIRLERGEYTPHLKK